MVSRLFVSRQIPFNLSFPSVVCTLQSFNRNCSKLQLFQDSVFTPNYVRTIYIVYHGEAMDVLNFFFHDHLKIVARL